MLQSRKGLYKRHGNYFEVCINGNASYLEFASSAAEVLKLSDPGGDNSLRLFRGDGAVISDDLPSKPSWTLKEYLTMIGRQPSQVRFGIGYVHSVSYNIIINIASV